VLYCEDDTLYPPDVWSRLSALLDSGYAAASGVQRDRHGSGLMGLWRYDAAIECFDPLVIQGGLTFEADAVGHYCLLTSADTYAACELPTSTVAPIDRSHTFQMRPIAVDSAVWCGHLLENGDVL
jgi:hypothetical protein